MRMWIPVLVAVMAAVPVCAHASHSPEGNWQGTIQGMLRLVLHVERATGGGLRGTLDSPDQGATGLAIDTVWVAGDSLFFTMKGLGAGYQARFGDGDSSLAGMWRQGGNVVPLDFKRNEKPVVFRRPQDPVRPYPYDTLEVVFPNAGAGVTLAGTLTTPRGTGPFPCALLITGSGPENRNEEIFGHRPFWVIAGQLTRTGSAVLGVDDRGVGGSTGSVRNSTSQDFAEDVLAGIEFLKGRKEIDPAKIGLVGHSEGGLIAPLVATRSRDVAFIVLMAGPGVRGDSLLLLQTAAMRRLQGTSPKAIEREQEVLRRGYALVRKGDSLGVVRATRELVDLQAEMMSDAERSAIGDRDSLARSASRQLFTPWIKFFFSYDPRAELARVRCPVLAINGSKDFQVPPKENLAGIAAALKAGGNRDATVKELLGLNHMFQTAKTGSLMEYSAIPETVAPAALEEMSGWIAARTLAKQ